MRVPFLDSHTALRDRLPDSVVLRQDSPGSTLDYPRCLVNLTHS